MAGTRRKIRGWATATAVAPAARQRDRALGTRTGPNLQRLPSDWDTSRLLLRQVVASRACFFVSGRVNRVSIELVRR